MDDDLLILFTEDEFGDDTADIVASGDSKNVGPNKAATQQPAESPVEQLFVDEPYEEFLEWLDNPVAIPSVASTRLTVEDWYWQDEFCEDDWQEEQQPPIADNNPRLTVEDAWDWDEHADDEWQEEQTTVNVNYAPTTTWGGDTWGFGPWGGLYIQQPQDDAWDWDEHADDEWQEEQQPSTTATIPQSPEDAWDWDEHADDEWQEEQQPPIPPFTPPALVEDAYAWDELAEDDWQEEQQPPIPDNNPQLTVEDWYWQDEFCEDDWQEEHTVVVGNASMVWTPVTDVDANPLVLIGNAQTPGWTQVIDMQNPRWQNLNDSQ